MTTPAAAAARGTSRGRLLSDPRSGARPLGNSPGAGPGPDPGVSSAGPGPSRPRPSSAARQPTPTRGRAQSARNPASGAAAPGRKPPAGGGGGKKPPKKKQSFAGKTVRALGSPPAEPHNYQAIILAEFVAAELLVAATPMATRRNQPGLSPYAATDLVQLLAIGVVYLILEMIASGGRGAGRISAWLGGLVLLTVGLAEAANIAKVFAFITGGSGKPSTHTTAAAAAPPTAIQSYLAAAPTIGATDSATSAGGGPGGGSGPHSGTAFVQQAAKEIGRPYVFGAAGPSAFDCSGLVEFALRALGVNAPRTSEEQWAWVDKIPQSQLAPGDLIFEQWPGEASPGHVAIYAGNGQIIQAPAPGQDVQRVKWSPSIVHAEGGQIVGFGRVPGLSYGGTAAPVPAAGEGGGNML